jgi:thiamine biosynthesis lipoprotein
VRARCGIVVVATGLAAAGAQSEPSRFEFAEVHMGMPVRLVLYAEEERDARGAARAAFARIAALDAALSDYRPDSDVNRVSNRAGSWVPVPAGVYAVLERAQQIARVTGGAFDPTVGPVVALWREARRTGRLPDSAVLEQARALVDWRRLELDPGRQMARLSTPGMRLDLGGIAKGFVLDEARRALRRTGVTRALIEAGGDIVAGDAPPGLTGWRVAVPGVTGALAGRAAALANAALASSGPSAQFVQVEGVRYSHVVDPATGYGVTGDAVVHVIAPDGATADALATAIGVIGIGCAGPALAGFPDVLAAAAGRPALGCHKRGLDQLDQQQDPVVASSS